MPFVYICFGTPFDFQRSRGVASRGGKTADCPSARDLMNDAVATRSASGRAERLAIGWHDASHVDMRPLACEFDQLSASVVLQKTVQEAACFGLTCQVLASLVPTWMVLARRGSSDGHFRL